MYSYEHEVRRLVELAKAEIMKPVKLSKRINIFIGIMSLILYAWLSTLDTYGLGVMIIASIFFVLPMWGTALVVYAVVRSKAKNVLRMIEMGDLVAAVTALEGMAAGGVAFVTIHASHFSAARGYLLQALALLSKMAEEKK